MEARVKDSARFMKYILFDGVEFFKGAWQYVPAQFQEEVKRTSILEYREQRFESGEFADSEIPLPPVIEKKYPKRGRKRKGVAGEFSDFEEDE
jgi:hypothetical protein